MIKYKWRYLGFSAMYEVTNKVTGTQTHIEMAFWCDQGFIHELQLRIG